MKPLCRRRGLCGVYTFLLTTVMSAVSAAAQTQSAPEPATGFAAKPLATADRRMVVAAHPLAAGAGLRILRAGGSAVDAAIAAQLVLNVVEPQSSGLGGGGFALSWDPEDRRLTSWDGREAAPAAAEPGQFLTPSGDPTPFLEAATSGRAVGAPGLAALLEAMHDQSGVLPWARLFEDAIRLAEEGFPVSPRLAASLKAAAPRLSADPAALTLFFDADGAPLAEGATLKQPDLAATLREIAARGGTAVAQGPIAEAILRAVAAPPRPGALTAEDLLSYQAVERPAVCGDFRGRYKVCGMGPPSSGGLTVAQILGLLNHTDPSAPPTLRRHWFLEASRLAYADRDRYLADPDQVAQPIGGLLSPGYLSVRAQELGLDRSTPGEAAPGAPPWTAPPPVFSSDRSHDRPGTTHVSVVDDNGRIVSMTSSIEIAFGAARMAAGFFLNNQLTDFSFRPEIDGRPVANALASGKRPRSSMAPTIVFERSADGMPPRPVFVLGSPGGSRIIEYVAGALVGLVDEGLDPAAAAARSHVSHRNRGSAVVEAGPRADGLAAALAARGHEVRRADMTSGLHIIHLEAGGRLEGGADPRREGAALGD